MPPIEKRIDLGGLASILAVLIMLAGGLIAYGRMSNRVDVAEREQARLSQSDDKLSRTIEVLTEEVVKLRVELAQQRRCQ